MARGRLVGAKARTVRTRERDSGSKKGVMARGRRRGRRFGSCQQEQHMLELTANCSL